jgi:hypothetical protein
MKPFWESKTFWAVLIAGLIGTWNALAAQFGWPPVPDWVITVLAALGLYGRATATGPLTLGGSDARSGDTRADAGRSRLR